MNFVEDYARNWAKRDIVEVDTLSKWVKVVSSFVKTRSSELEGSMKTIKMFVLHDPNVSSHMSNLLHAMSHQRD